MTGLDEIPWKKLKHAYGSAEDVPELLRALQTASPDVRGEESPLWQLFGNIYHQGTVYEATPYAVPFLIALAANPRTPDRVGILGLLAAIAESPDHRPATQRLAARQAVEAGFKAFVAMTKERTAVRIGAAHVLAQLSERAKEVASIIRAMLNSRMPPIHRAGLLLLLGQTQDRSAATLAVLSAAVRHRARRIRRAAAVSLATLRLKTLPPGARNALMELFLEESLEETFEGLPWDADGEINHDALAACLDESGREGIADILIAAVESGEPTHRQVEVLVNLLFPLKPGRASILTARELSPLQHRAVRAMASAMKGGRRIFCGHFPCWGLPDTMREWADLAAGRQPTPVDESLPLLARAGSPRKDVSPAQLKVGDEVIHRYFGKGKVTKVTPGSGAFTRITVRFEDEGVVDLALD